MYKNIIHSADRGNMKISSHIMVEIGTLPKDTKGILFSALEIVAHAPLGVDVLRLPRVYFNLFSEAADMNINGSHLTGIVIAPHDGKQVIPAVHLIRMEGQKFKQSYSLAVSFTSLSST